MSPRIARFDWDEANVGHIARHGVMPREVEEAVHDRYCLIDTSETRQGALRYKVVGETESGKVLVVVFEMRGHAMRPVTAYTAPNKKEVEYLARRKDVD